MQSVRERPIQKQGSVLWQTRCRSAVRGGFTLTEVLVVAVIIGLLLGLVSAAVFPAIDSAKEFATYSEAANLSMAMESLKAQYGATPPADQPMRLHGRHALLVRVRAADRQRQHADRVRHIDPAHVRGGCD